MLRDDRIKMGIFITNASLIIGDYKFSSKGYKEFVVYPAGEKIFLFVSFALDKTIEKKLEFIYITPDVSFSSLIDYQHLIDITKRTFFFELNNKDLDLLDKFKIAGFETDKSKSKWRPIPKDFIYVSPLIINSIPSKQIELSKLINSKDENMLSTLLSKMSIIGSDHHQNQIAEKFICPITLDIMNEPAICILDGKTYEKSAISQWLDTHRSAPSNRTLMEPHQTIEDVLIIDYNLIKLINFYKLQHPELFNESDSEPQNHDGKTCAIKY